MSSGLVFSFQANNGVHPSLPFLFEQRMQNYFLDTTTPKDTFKTSLFVFLEAEDVRALYKQSCQSQ